MSSSWFHSVRRAAQSSNASSAVYERLVNDDTQVTDMETAPTSPVPTPFAPVTVVADSGAVQGPAVDLEWQQPLFRVHVETPLERWLTLTLMIGLSFLVIVTLLFSLLIGFTRNGAHVALGLLILAHGTGLGVLIKWYRAGELEPRFRRFIIIQSLILVGLVAVSQVYIWQLGPSQTPVTIGDIANKR